MEHSVILHLPDSGHAYAAHLVIKAIIVVITVKATVRKTNKDSEQARQSSLTSHCFTCIKAHMQPTECLAQDQMEMLLPDE